MTYEEWLDSLDPQVAKCIERIVEKAGTSDACAFVLEAAGELLAEAEGNFGGLERENHRN